MIFLVMMAALLFCFDAAILTAAAVAAQRGGLVLRLRSAIVLLVICLTAVAQAAIVVYSGEGVPSLAIAAAVGCAIVSALTDGKSGFIFDLVTLPTLMLVALISLFTQNLGWCVYGTLSVGGSLGVLYLVTKGRGLGLGDVKLGCCIGAALGAADGLVSLGLSFVLGGVYAAFLLLSRRAGRHDAVRFGPYLAAGMLSVLFYRMVK